MMARGGRVSGAAATAAVALVFAPSAAGALGVSELHMGVLQHDTALTRAGMNEKEGGVDIQAELAFRSPEALKLLGAPKPTLVASGNTNGDTSFVGAGLAWRWQFAQRWSLEPGLGYVIHTGERENPFAPGSARERAFARSNALLGSRDLFRLSLGVSRRLSDRVSAQAFFEHLSHGQILGEGSNEGLDNVGVRLGYHFGDGR